MKKLSGLAVSMQMSMHNTGVFQLTLNAACCILNFLLETVFTFSVAGRPLVSSK